MAKSFETTHWSLVMRAGQDPSEVQREALGELVAAYLGAMRTYVQMKFRVPPDRADELVAGFTASRLVERQLVGKADAARGKFRNFLMTALQRYVIDHIREETAQKRSGELEPDDSQAPSPERAFEAHWARTVIQQAIDAMRAQTDKRPDLWGVFADRVLGPAFDGTSASAYAELVPRLGFADEGQAANALLTAKRIFARVLRGVVAEYAESASDVDDELVVLMAALTA